MSIISIYNHLKSDFLVNNTLKALRVPRVPESTPHSPRKEILVHLPEDNPQDNFREMGRGGTCGFRQQRELGQPLWVRTRLYLSPVSLGVPLAQQLREDDTAQALPQPWGGCSRAEQVRSSCSRRVQSPSEHCTHHQLQVGRNTLL